VIRRLWSRVRLTPRLGIVIVLALIATEVLRELLVTLVPPPNVLFYTRDWLADQAAHAVRVIEASRLSERDSVFATLSSDWLAFSATSETEALEHGSDTSLDVLRTTLERRLGSQVRRVLVSGTWTRDRDSATTAITVMLDALPAVLTHVQSNRMQKENDMIVVTRLQLALQLNDGTWIAITEPHREHAFARQVRNVSLLIIGLALIAGFALLAARMIIRPLKQLAAAADRLGRERELTPVHRSDVPELDAIADSFNQMQQRLKRFVDERTHMLAAISHDLRTPLTRLRLFAEYVSDPQQRALVLSDISEMEQMLTASLTFVGDEARREPHSRVDLAALLISLCDTVTDAGARATYTGPDHAQLPCQPVAMRRAFANLIDNACKYGFGALVTLAERSGALEITVADTGPGIPAELVEQAFAPFTRLEASRNRESGGAGLGLSIARDVVHGHGGSIMLEPNTPVGLVARVWLPKPKLPEEMLTPAVVQPGARTSV
jgi:signal transduction histidine kinase